MRNRKYVEIESLGRKIWASATMNRVQIARLERGASGFRTGRTVTLDTDFSVQGTWKDWDREAARRISAKLGEAVEVVRF